MLWTFCRGRLVGAVREDGGICVVEGIAGAGGELGTAVGEAHNAVQVADVNLTGEPADLVCLSTVVDVSQAEECALLLLRSNAEGFARYVLLELFDLRGRLKPSSVLTFTVSSETEETEHEAHDARKRSSEEDLQASSREVPDMITQQTFATGSPWILDGPVVCIPRSRSIIIAHLSSLNRHGEMSFAWAMNEVFAPEKLRHGSLSCVGSFCLHFDISAPMVVWRFCMASDGSSKASEGTPDSWHLTAQALTSPPHPRYALPTFSPDVSHVATHVVQVAARSRCLQAGLGGSRLVVGTSCGRVLLVDMAGKVLATLALSTSCVQQLWVVEQVVASGGRQGAAHDRAGSTGGRALSGVESRSKTYGKAAGGTYILAKTREGLEGTLVDLSRDMVVQGRGRGDVARAARLGDSAGGHLDSPNCFVASFSAHRTAILVGALPHHVGESLVMLDLGMPSKLSGKALALDQLASSRVVAIEDMDDSSLYMTASPPASGRHSSADSLSIKPGAAAHAAGVGFVVKGVDGLSKVAASLQAKREGLLQQLMLLDRDIKVRKQMLLHTRNLLHRTLHPTLPTSRCTAQAREYDLTRRAMHGRLVDIGARHKKARPGKTPAPCSASATRSGDLVLPECYGYEYRLDHTLGGERLTVVAAIRNPYAHTMIGVSLCLCAEGYDSECRSYQQDIAAGQQGKTSTETTAVPPLKRPCASQAARNGGLVEHVHLLVSLRIGPEERLLAPLPGPHTLKNYPLELAVTAWVRLYPATRSGMGRLVAADHWKGQAIVAGLAALFHASPSSHPPPPGIRVLYITGGAGGAEDSVWSGSAATWIGLGVCDESPGHTLVQVYSMHQDALALAIQTIQAHLPEGTGMSWRKVARETEERMLTLAVEAVAREMQYGLGLLAAVEAGSALENVDSRHWLGLQIDTDSIITELSQL